MVLRSSSASSAPSMAQLQALLSNATPPGEAVTPVPGSGGMASRDDHKHPRLSSATVQSLNASGEAVITFTRTFSSMPVVICLLYETADNQPVVFKVKSWTQDAQNNYTGCTIKGSRASLLPALSGITLLAGLITALANFNVFGGSAAGAQFCCLAIQPSN